jgi:hypothetical protein
MPARVERISISDLAPFTWRQRLDDALDQRASSLVVLDGPVAAWESLDTEGLKSIAAVTLAVVRNGTAEPPAAAAACDLCASVNGDIGEGWEWLGPGSDLDGWIDLVAARLDRSPLAATVLARTLRLTECAPVADALVVESLAYSVLQAGPEHQQWLTNRHSQRSKPRSWTRRRA